jgi:hypothetical protein
MQYSTLAARASALVLALPLAAQTPFVPRADLWVTDSNNDRVDRMRDLNYDGDYDDAGEVTVFYDDTLGPFALSTNNSIASRIDGVVFVGDTTADAIYALEDSNGDGDANDAGEAWPYFNSLTNAGGVAMPSVAGMCVSGTVLWVANSQSGSSGKDSILRLEDLNNDGDANDLGEAKEYYVSSDLSLGGSAGDSLPQDVHVGLDGNIYYVDIPSSGPAGKGIYKLVDLDSSGAIDQPGEMTPFFIPPAQTGAAFHWAIEQDPAGYWYMQDTGNDFIWRGRDNDNNGSIDPVTEAVKWWISPAASLAWDLRVASDGNLYVCDAQTNDRIFVMKDADASGTVDPVAEVITAYNEVGAAGAAIGTIRGFALDAQWQTPSRVYCSGQANTLACTSALGFLGWPSATHGSGYYLNASNLRNQKSGLFFYGLSGSQATPFNGGTMCVAPPRVRTPLQSSGGSSTGDDCTGSASIDFNAHIASAVDPALIAGVVVDVQYWSRDPGSTPGNTNLSDAVEFVILR